MTKDLIERWTRRWRRDDPKPAPVTVPSVVPATEPAIVTAPPADVVLDLEREMRSAFPDEYPSAAASAKRVIDALPGADLSSLARRSPSLRGYDWTNYLRCSVCRVVRVQHALRAHLAPGARVLDYGSYFGNFGLAVRALGFDLHAVDSYADYGGAFDPWIALQRDAGITIHDFSTAGYDLQRIGVRPFDAVICAGVIEHMPHTPRPLLDTLNAILKPGGILVMDTPNLGYLYKRLALLEGQSIFAPIQDQYFTEIPFEGHHREYTVDEVRWLLRQAGHELLDLQTFNYSMFGAASLSGEHAEYFHAMMADASLRELIVSVSRRP